tara:strand:- start:329 stop:1075 length:747 start_codon:yes stop_codon:yes gene_type:complete
MINYKLKYLKYKEKYLTTKKSKISIDNLMNNLSEIYQLVDSNYDEIYVTGSIAILALAYFLNKNLIPKDYPIPNDIDFIIYQNNKLDNTNLKKISEYKRVDDNLTKFTTFKSSTSENYFKSFKINSTNNPVYHHIINYNGNNIKIYKISSLKKAYQDNLNNSSTKDYDKKKISLINKIEKYFSSKGLKLATEFNPPIIEKRNKKQFGFNNSEYIRKVDDFTVDLAINNSETNSSSEELKIPRIIKKFT